MKYTIIDKLKNVVQNHNGTKNHFLVKYSKNGLNSLQTQKCFIGFYNFINNYPFYLAILMGRIKSMDAMKELLPVLCDEVGVGKSQSHLEMYRDFLSNIGVVDVSEKSLYLDVEINKFLERSYSSKDIVYAIGVFFALETMAEQMMNYLNEGLKESGYDEKIRKFFIIHIEAEKEHAEHGEGLFIKLIDLKDDKIITTFSEGVNDFMEHLEFFWDGVSAKLEN